MDAKLAKAIDACKKEIKDLKAKLDKVMPAPDTQFVPDKAAETKIADVTLALKTRRFLKGHFGKIYCMQWCDADAHQLLSGGQDGRLILWDAKAGNKLQAVPLASSWVMTCGLSGSGGLSCSGGLDNTITVWKMNAGADKGAAAPIVASLVHHDGYVSCARFIKDEQLISTSGDGTGILWDLHTKSPQRIFRGHQGDVMCVDVDGGKNIFVTGSVDATARIWDLRKEEPVTTLRGHESDLNSVRFLPDGNQFISGADDATVRLWDIRALTQLCNYKNEKLLSSVTSVDISKTARIIFAGYDDHHCYAWDSLTGKIIANNEMMHDNRVSVVGVSADGKALCTGSWDQYLKVWA